MKETRTAQVLIGGYWEDMPFMMLQTGDIFRLFEEDGGEVDNGQICIAERPAARADGRVAGVRCEPAGRVLNPRIRYSTGGD